MKKVKLIGALFICIACLSGCKHQMSYTEAELTALEYFGNQFCFIEKKSHITSLTGYSDGKNFAFCFGVSEILYSSMLAGDSETFTDRIEIVTFTPLNDGSCSKDDYEIEDFNPEALDKYVRAPILYEAYQQLLKKYTYRREYTEEECEELTKKYIMLTESLFD